MPGSSGKPAALCPAFLNENKAEGSFLLWLQAGCVEAVILHSHAQLPHEDIDGTQSPAWPVQERCVQHDTSVNEHCRKSQPAHKDRRLLLANWGVIPVFD